MRILGILIILISINGCAKKASDIKATYVSSTHYKKFTCEELEEELYMINKKMKILSGEVDSHAKKDKVKTGVGAILFWPTLFFLKGDSREAG